MAGYHCQTPKGVFGNAHAHAFKALTNSAVGIYNVIHLGTFFVHHH